MALSDDLTRLVQDGKRCQTILHPYNVKLVESLKREIASIYCNLESGFTTQSRTPLPLNPSQIIQENNKESNSNKLTSSISQAQPSQKGIRSHVDTVHLQHMAQFLALYRIKRALYIYHYLRIQNIQQHIWQTGHLPIQKNKLLIKKSMSISINDSFSFNNNKKRLTAHTNSEGEDLKSKKSKSVDNTTYISKSNVPELSKNLSLQEKQFGIKYQNLMQNVASKFPLIDLMGSMKPPSKSLIQIRVKQDCEEIQTYNGAIKLVKGQQIYVRKNDVEQLLKDGKVIQI